MDHHLPRYHLRTPRGFTNDPNGPILIDGVLHLYYQSRTTTDLREPVSWGHASSADLVHWTHHRPALSPLPGGPDRDGCWSGNTVATDDGIRAFYSGFREDAPLQDSLSALSRDGGATFGAPRTVVPAPPGLAQFRDPFVWRDGDRWRMAAGAGSVDQVASILTWESRDLEHWVPGGVLAELPRTVIEDPATGRVVDTGGMWECPQVLEVDGTTVALVGAWGADTGIMRVLAVLPDGGGDRLGGVGAHPIDDGTAFYAPSVLRDGPCGPLVFGWVVEDRDVAEADGWAGTISLPRVLRMGAGGRMLSSPATEVEALRLGAAVRADAEGLEGLSAQLELGLTAAPGGGVRVGFGGVEHLDLRVDVSGAAVIERASSGSDPRARREELRIPSAVAAGRCELRVFVDGSVVEVFTGTGRVATTRVYPTSAPPWSVTPLGGAEVSVWELG